MKSQTKLIGLTVVLMAAIFLLGLTGNIQVPVTNNLHYPQTDQAERVHLVDGDYSVQTKYFTPQGYRPQLKMSVRNGFITKIDYMEPTANHSEISENVAYIQSLKTTVEKYNESRWQSISSIIMNQNPYVLPRMSKEPMHESLFRSLAITCFKNAEIGKKETTQINDFVWTYRAKSDEANIDGHYLELTATFNGDALIELQAVTYDADHARTVNGYNFNTMIAQNLSQQTIDPLDPTHFSDTDLAFLTQYNELLLKINALRSGL